MKLRIFLDGLSRPVVVVALVVVALLIAGGVQYPLRSVGVSLVRPTSGVQQPVIAPPPEVLGASTAARTKPLPKLALSFDDGPNPDTTPLILGTLEKEQVRASFFVVGSRVAGNEKLLQREYRDGDDIGNHSWNHPNFTNLSSAQITSQINRTEQAVAAAGVPAPFMFRPPYGSLGPHFPKRLPLAVILWNIDPEDWDDHDSGDLTKRIVAQARPGGIIDLHGIYASTAKAIGPAIKKLKQHYQLVPVSQLMRIGPGDTGKYYGYR